MLANDGEHFFERPTLAQVLAQHRKEYSDGRRLAVRPWSASRPSSASRQLASFGVARIASRMAM
jgi:hypothetical protein